jgi:hypothetical protein
VLLWPIQRDGHDVAVVGARHEQVPVHGWHCSGGHCTTPWVCRLRTSSSV